ncbi:MAG TPA: DUF2062 domain-containing protein [Burkholderiales bacterium]|nr:DUF2062 domain-containing protein [Burkholderiales bacterium]
MPRKFFRKYLPTHETILRNRWIARFGSLLRHPNLWHLNRRSVAGGFAAGLFAGLIPGPFQMIGAAVLSVIFRINLPVAVFTTLYTNPVTIVPLYLVAYQIGRLFAGGSGVYSAPPPFTLEQGWRDWLSDLLAWAAHLGEPLLIGVPLLALLLAVIGYFVVDLGWRCYTVTAWRTRQRRRGKAASAR